MNAKQEATAAILGWELDRSPSTEMRDGNWYRHGSTYEVKGEEAVLELVEERDAFVAEFYDIWRCFYDGTCPTCTFKTQNPQ